MPVRDKRLDLLRHDFAATGWSLREFEEHTGLKKSWLAKLLKSGEGRVTWPRWVILAKALGVPESRYAQTVELTRAPGRADTSSALTGGEGEEEPMSDRYGVHIMDAWRALEPSRRLKAWQCVMTLLQEQFAEEHGLTPPTTTPPARPSGPPRPTSGR